ncbi:MAG: DUF4118 domain-containing protein [Holophaga sp.]|nr:DUF4118 domain-containing protein [Holophaga sp.]
MTQPEHSNPLLLALGSDAQAVRLIHAAFWAAREKHRPWIALHVHVPSEEAADEQDQARLWLEEAQSLGAATLWIQARTRVAGLLEAVKQTGAGEIMMGWGQDRWPWGRLGHSTAQELLRRQPAIRITSIPLGPEIPRHSVFPPKTERLGALFGSLGILGACAGLGAILPPELPLPAIFLLFLLATALIAQRWGLGAGALAVAASGLIFDLAFDSAQGSLTVGNWPMLALFLVVLGGGQFAVALSERLNQQTRASRRRAALQAALLLLGRNLAKGTTHREVAEALNHLGERLLHRSIHLLLLQKDGHWKPLLPPGPELEFAIPTFLPNAQREALEPHLDGTHAYLPLGHGGALEGVLCITAHHYNDLDEEAWELLRGFAVQVALALERVRWLDTAQRAKLENETERMRSALLGAISHDLRTPLAGIQGAASTLLLSESIPESTRRDLLAMIHGESQRLTQLVTNLLDLTRLESGAIRVQKEWHSLQEVLGSALRRTESQKTQVEIDLPENLPLVAADGALLEQLLINLLENASRHAPGCPVALRAWTTASTLEIKVADQGPGIPDAYRTRVFDKFFRLPGRGQDGGVGLGLAICDAIAKAHGGTICAESNPGGGACFHVSLPREDPPPLPPAAEEMAP